jgi:hypothetical protein
MKKSWIFVWTIILTLTIGLSVYFIKSMIDANKVYPVEGANFTLNDIVSKLNENATVKKYRWHPTTRKNVIVINKFEFKYVDGCLVLKTSNKNGRDIFPYLLDAVESFYGGLDGEYLETGKKFAYGEIQVNGLEYSLNKKVFTIKIDLLNKVQKYDILKQIKGEYIMPINEIDYEFFKESFLNYKEDYKINNIAMNLSQDNLNYVFKGLISNSERDYDINLIIKYYDKDKNNILENKYNLNDFKIDDKFYAPIEINVPLKEINAKDIVYYSINLEK